MDKLRKWFEKCPELAYTCMLAFLLLLTFVLIKAGSLIALAALLIALSVLYVWGSVKSAYFSLTALLLVMLFNFSVPISNISSIIPFLNDSFITSVLGIHPHFLPQSPPTVLKLYDWAVLLALFSGALRMLLRRNGQVTRKRDMLCKLVYVFAALLGAAVMLSFMLHERNSAALGRLKNYIEPLCLLFAFLGAFEDDAHIKPFKRFLLYYGAVLAVMQVINIFRIESVANNIISKSVFNSWGASNTIVPVYLAVGAVAYPEVFKRGQKRNPLLVFEFVLVAICAFLTLSRGGVVAAAIGLCAFFVLFKHDRWLIVRLAATLAVAGVVLIAMTAVVWGVYNPTESQSVIERGILLEQFAGGVNVGSVLFGQGLAAANELLHNDYLQVFSDGGLVAFAAFAGFMGAIFLKFYRQVKSGKSDTYFSSLICVFAGWAAHCVVEPVFSVERLMMLFILLVAAGMYHSNETTRSY